MMGDDRPPVYWEADNLIIRASALGTSCLWELTAAGQGYPPGLLPAALKRAFQEGNDLEPIVIEILKDEYHIVFNSHQREYNYEIEPGIIIRFHPDGEAFLGSQFYILTNTKKNLTFLGRDAERLPPRTVIVEIKALSNVLWQKFASKGMSTVIDEYPWQLSSMMAYSNLPGLWVGYNKGNPPDENGVREPCPDEGKLHFELCVHSPVMIDDLRAKAIQIKELVTGEDILESGKPCDSPSNWPCRYQHLRPEPEDIPTGPQSDGDKRILVVEDTDMDEVNRAVRQYIYSKGQADELDATAKRERDNILSVGEGYDQIVTDTWIIPIHGSEAKTSYIDHEAMRADGIDVEKYRKEKPKSRYINKRNIKRRTD